MGSGLEIERLRGRLGRAMAECDALRRQLAERDAADREAEASFVGALRGLRDLSAEQMQWINIEAPNDAVSLAAVVRRAVEEIHSAPPRAIAAVLAAGEDDAAVLREWQTTAACKSSAEAPTPLGAVARSIILSPIAPGEVERLTEAALRGYDTCDGAHDESWRAATIAVAAAVEASLTERHAAEVARLTAERDRVLDTNVEALSLAGRYSVRAEKAEAELAELRAARQPAPLSDEEVERLAEAASYQRHYMEDPVDWRAIVRALLAHPLVASRMTGEPQRSEATGPLVDAIGRILRDTIDHEPDFRRGAERIAAEVARRLPTVDVLADDLSHDFEDGEVDYERDARWVLGRIRQSLGLDAAPEREEPAAVESDGTWATLPEEVRDAMVQCEWARPYMSRKHQAAREHFAAVLHRHMRHEPDAVSVEDVATVIELHVTGGVPRATTVAAARTIVARYGSPQPVPVLALPSEEEVAAIVSKYRDKSTARYAVDDLIDAIEARQPADVVPARASVLGPVAEALLEWFDKLSDTTEAALVGMLGDAQRAELRRIIDASNGGE